MHVLVIGQHGVGLTAVAVDIPDAQKSQQDRGILLQGCLEEVLVLKEQQGEWGLSSCQERKEGL